MSDARGTPRRSGGSVGTQLHFAGFGEASEGRATLRFRARTPSSPRLQVLEFGLNSDTWHQTGNQPFLWDMRPPVGQRAYPIIRIVADRKTEITTRYAGKFESGTTKQQTSLPENGELKPIRGEALFWPDPGFRALKPVAMPGGYGRYAVETLGGLFGSARAEPLLAPWLPLVQVIRPQRSSVIANLAREIRLADLLLPPHTMQPQLSRSNDSKRLNRTVRVSETPVGVEFQQFQGKYRVDVRIKNPLKPAAFCYEVVRPEESERNYFFLYVIHCSNVKVTKHATKGNKDKALVGALQLDRPDVPDQGAQIEMKHADLVDKMKTVHTSSDSTRRGAAIDLADMAIGAFPIIGDLYDLGQFAYGAATGEDFWGRKLSPTDLALLGGAILLPFGLKARN